MKTTLAVAAMAAAVFSSCTVQAALVKIEFAGVVVESSDSAGGYLGTAGEGVHNGKSILLQLAFDTDLMATSMGEEMSGGPAWMSSRVLVDGTLIPDYMWVTDGLAPHVTTWTTPPAPVDELVLWDGEPAYLLLREIEDEIGYQWGNNYLAPGSTEPDYWESPLFQSYKSLSIEATAGGESFLLGPELDDGFDLSAAIDFSGSLELTHWAPTCDDWQVELGCVIVDGPHENISLAFHGTEARQGWSVISEVDEGPWAPLAVVAMMVAVRRRYR